MRWRGWLLGTLGQLVGVLPGLVSEFVSVRGALVSKAVRVGAIGDHFIVLAPARHFFGVHRKRAPPRPRPRRRSRIFLFGNLFMALYSGLLPVVALPWICTEADGHAARLPKRGRHVRKNGCVRDGIGPPGDRKSVV
jgi:hypothetical protein